MNGQSPVPSMEDIAELKRLGGIRTDGNEVTELLGWSRTYVIEVEERYLGTACHNNSTWALVTVDGQLWSFFRTENPDILQARYAIFDKLSKGRWNHVPYSNGGQDQLIGMILAADAPELDPMVKAELKTYV